MVVVAEAVGGWRYRWRWRWGFGCGSGSERVLVSPGVGVWFDVWEWMATMSVCLSVGCYLSFDCVFK